MCATHINRQVVHERVRAVLKGVVGYELDPGVDQLSDLDSLQILELLVSLEEEFNVDSDEIIESNPDWWISLNDLVESVIKASTRPSLGARE